MAGAAPAGGKRSHFLAYGNSTRSCSLAIGMCQLRTSPLQLLTFPWLFQAHLQLPLSKNPHFNEGQFHGQQTPRNSPRVEGRKRKGRRRLLTMLACQPSTLTQRSMHHQKSSSDSPFQANTATPERTGAALELAGLGRALSCSANSTNTKTQPRGHAEITSQPTPGPDLSTPP